MVIDRSWKRKVLLIANIVYVMLTVYWDRNFFNFHSVFNANAAILYGVIKILWICSIILFEKIIYYLIVNRQTLYCRIFIRFCIIYIFLYAVIFALLFPGNWGAVGDEFLLYWGAVNLFIWPQQGMVAGMIMIWELMFYPAAWMPILIQLLITSGILSHISARMYVNNKKFTSIWLLLTAFSFPSITYATNPMRMWLFSVCYLAFVSELFLVLKDMEMSNNQIVYLTVLVILIVNLRTESKYMLIFFPIIVWYLLKERERVFKTIVKVVMIIFASTIVITGIYVNLGGGDEYRYNSLSLVSFVCPLSVILINEESNLDGMGKDLENIDQVFPLKDMAAYSSDILFWNQQKWIDQYNNPSKKEVIKFTCSAAKIIIKNLPLYLRSRLKMFLACTCSHGVRASGIAEIKEWGEHNHFTSANLYKYFDYDNPYRERCSNLVGGYVDELKIMNVLEWNFIIPTFITIFLSIWGLLTKRRNYAITMGFLVIQFIMFYLLIPSAHNMYYILYVLCGWLFFGMFVSDITTEFLARYISSNRKER